MTRKLTATSYDDYKKLRYEVGSDGVKRNPDNADLIAVVAYDYRFVLNDAELTDDERVGYIVAVCATDPVLPGYWMTTDRKVFAKNVLAYHAAPKEAVS